MAAFFHPHKKICCCLNLFFDRSRKKVFSWVASRKDSEKNNVGVADRLVSARFHWFTCYRAVVIPGAPHGGMHYLATTCQLGRFWARPSKICRCEGLRKKERCILGSLPNRSSGTMCPRALSVDALWLYVSLSPFPSALPVSVVVGLKPLPTHHSRCMVRQHGSLCVPNPFTPCLHPV